MPFAFLKYPIFDDRCSTVVSLLLCSFVLSCFVMIVSFVNLREVWFVQINILNFGPGFVPSGPDCTGGFRSSLLRVIFAFSCMSEISRESLRLEVHSCNAVSHENSRDEVSEPIP